MSLYQSIAGSTVITNYELIFVSPYDLPIEMRNINNVRIVKDFGCPSRCYQLGLLASQGEYVIWAADDGVFTPNKCIDKAFSSISAMTESKKNIVSFRYREGRSNESKKMDKPNWWKMGTHLHSKPYITIGRTIAPDDYYLVMNGLINREYLIDIGGFDCNFEHLGFGAVDLAIRLQNDCANVVLGKKFMDITWSPGNTGDHGPIHNAHSKHDWPLFRKIYSDPSSATRSRISIDNWKCAEEKWSRRFGNG